jgi:hypothetical protein
MFRRLLIWLRGSELARDLRAFRTGPRSRRVPPRAPVRGFGEPVGRTTSQDGQWAKGGES